jgi:hypothetical protein
MFIAAHVVSFTLRAHDVFHRDPNCQTCLYFSLLGLSVSLTFLRLCGPQFLIQLVNAG